MSPEEIVARATYNEDRPDNDPDWERLDQGIQRAYLEIARAALQALRDAGVHVEAWQPIETAPKDETNIVFFDPQDGVHVGWWSRSIWVHPGAWVIEVNRSDTSVFEPTHWMPLPRPPLAAAPGAGGSDGSTTPTT